jgi:hypothetical protein
MVAYPVGYIAQMIRTDWNDNWELYPLPDEFPENFVKMYEQYVGIRPTMEIDFPKEWGVVMVERLREGRELFQIQSQNREWIFLVITSGYGTHRILDILPVAVDLANQTPDIIETELWTTEREVDGSFAVTKKYEWKKSLANVTQKEYEANPQDYFRKNIKTDKYIINDSYHFEKIVIEDVPDYSVVIIYYKDEKPEDWEEVTPMLQAFCEDYSILSLVAHSNFSQILLYDYKLNYITDLDITPYTDLSEGVIFMKKGETPKSVPFGSYERIRSEVKRYFKIIEI